MILSDNHKKELKYLYPIDLLEFKIIGKEVTQLKSEVVFRWILLNLVIWVFAIIIHESGHVILAYLTGGSFSNIQLRAVQYNIYLIVSCTGGNKGIIALAGPAFEFFFLGILSIKHAKYTILSFFELIIYIVLDLTLIHFGDFSIFMEAVL